MSRMTIARAMGPALMLAAMGASPARAEASEAGLAEAKALYAAAAYAEALAAVSDADTAEAHEYRALCLLALGRQDEAEQAAEAMVRTDPRYSLPTEERPPRFVKLVAATRQRVLPTMIRTLFAAARKQYQGENRAESRDQFSLVLALAEAPEVRELDELADVRLLAQGFLDLLAASAQPRPVVNPPAQATAAADPGAANRLPSVTQPEPVRQALPPFPPRVTTDGRPLAGMIRLVVGVDGRVKSAAIERSVHPSYDALLLAAAQGWLYRPATVNGKPVEAERFVQVRIAGS